MSKRLIFSIFSKVETGVSTTVNDYTRRQFKLFYTRIKDLHEKYAEFCGADYKLINPEISDYALLQFEKIRLLEEFANEYDEIVYIDFDVIPVKFQNIFVKFQNIFEELDFSKINILHLERANISKYGSVVLKSSMDISNKILFKQSLLGNKNLNTVVNTGIICGDSNAIKELDYTKRIQDLNKIIDDIKENSILPEEIVDQWQPNNEVYFSYILEKYNIQTNNMPEYWHNIVEENGKQLNKLCYLAHVINKKFELFFD